MNLLLRYSGLKNFLSILFFLLLHLAAFSQDTGRQQKNRDSAVLRQAIKTVNDSVKPDTAQQQVIPKKIIRRTALANDSLKADSTKAFVADSLRRDSLQRDSLQKAIQQTSIKKIQKKPVINLMPGIQRQAGNNDVIFYILIFLLFFLGLVKTSFPKYVNSIFSLSFQATFRQTQTKEQMEQNFFPAFMLNVLFVLCGGLFITLFAQLRGWSKLPFWELFVYATAMLLIIYSVKYIVISFTGWVFNVKEAVAEYRFVVFLINKVLAILLLPLLFLIAYGNYQTKNIAVTIVICLAVLALSMRYLFSLSRIRKNLNLTAFHFFVYLCAAEIVPLLVIYKILFLQTSNV